MKMLKSVYQDNKGRVWEIERCSVPKFRGEYKYWIAECKEHNLCIKEYLKRDIKKRIEES